MCMLWKERGIYPHRGKEGPWCRACFGESYYDGLERRLVPLTLKQTKKLRLKY